MPGIGDGNIFDTGGYVAANAATSTPGSVLPWTIEFTAELAADTAVTPFTAGADHTNGTAGAGNVALTTLHSASDTKTSFTNIQSAYLYGSAGTNLIDASQFAGQATLDGSLGASTFVVSPTFQDTIIGSPDSNQLDLTAPSGAHVTLTNLNLSVTTGSGTIVDGIAGIVNASLAVTGPGGSINAGTFTGVTGSTFLSTLTNGFGTVSSNDLTFTLADGVTTVNVSLSGAQTLSDVLTLIDTSSYTDSSNNVFTPLTATLTASGISVTDSTYNAASPTHHHGLSVTANNASPAGQELGLIGAGLTTFSSSNGTITGSAIVDPQLTLTGSGGVNLTGGSGTNVFVAGAGTNNIVGQSSAASNLLMVTADGSMTLTNSSLTVTGTSAATDTLTNITSAALYASATTAVITLDASVFSGSVILSSGGDLGTLIGNTSNATFIVAPPSAGALAANPLIQTVTVDLAHSGGSGDSILVEGINGFTGSAPTWLTRTARTASLATTIDGGDYVNISSFNLGGPAPYTIVGGDIVLVNGTGTAGDLTISGSNIDINNEQLTATGIINISGTAYEPFTTSFDHNDYVTDSITIENHSKITGSLVNIDAHADGAHFNAPVDASGNTDVNGLINTAITGILSFLNNLSLFVSFAREVSPATVTLDATSSIIATTDVDITALADGNVAPKPTIAKVAGLAIAVLLDHAEIDIAGAITAGDGISLLSTVNNTVNAIADVTGIKTGSAAAAVVVSVIQSNSTVDVMSSATLTAGTIDHQGSIEVEARTNDASRLMSRSTTGVDGSTGVAIGGDYEDTQTNAYLDGTASTSPLANTAGDSAAGGITVTASEVRGDIAYNTLLILPTSGTGVLSQAGVGTVSTGNPLDNLLNSGITEFLALKYPAKAVDAIGTVVGKLVAPLSKLFAGNSGKQLGAALSLEIYDIGATARIGDGSHAATVTAGGAVEVEAKVESSPHMSTFTSVSSGVKNPVTSVVDPSKVSGTAVSIGVAVIDNEAHATISNLANVVAASGVAVISNAQNKVDPNTLWLVDLVTPFLALGASPTYTTDSGDSTLHNGDTVLVEGDHQSNGTTGQTYKYIGANNASIDLSNTDLSDTSLWTEQGTLGWSVAENFLTSLISTFGLQNNPANTSTVSLASGAKSIKAGSITVLVQSYVSDAEIQGGANINQSGVHGGQVTVQALATDDLIQVGGALAFPGACGLASMPAALVKAAKATDASALGGTIITIVNTSTATAKIDDGAKVNADSLYVDAQSNEISVILGVAGGAAPASATNGVILVTVENDTTIAQVGRGAIVTIGSTDAKDGSTDLGAAAVIKAGNTGIFIDVAGAVSVADKSAIGITVGVNDITRDTEAVLGDLQGQTASGPIGSFTSGGGTDITSGNSGFVGVFSVAGSGGAAGKTPPAPPASPDTSASGASFADAGAISNGQGDTGDGSIEDLAFALLNWNAGAASPGGNQSSADTTEAASQGQSGEAISGAVTVDITNDTAKSYVKDAGVVTVGNSATAGINKALTISADNSTDVASLSGAVAISLGTGDANTTGIAGALGFNFLGGVTSAEVDSAAQLNANSLSLSAVREGYNIALAAGVAGASGLKGESVAGSVAVARSAYTIDTLLQDTSGTISGSVTLDAEDDSAIIMVAGAVSYGGKLGVGAAFSFTDIENTVTSTIQDVSSLGYDGNLEVEAQSNPLIVGVTGSVGVSSTAGGGSGTLTLNFISDTVGSHIIDSTLTDHAGASDNVTVLGKDNATISSIAGAVGVGKTDGAGIALGLNSIKDSIAGTIDGSTITTGGNVDVEALSDSTIGGAVVGVGVTVQNAVGFALAGSLQVNFITDTLDAHISKDTAATPVGSNVTAGGSVTVNAADTSLLVAIAGAVGLAVSGATGVGASISYNRVANGIAAYIDDSTVKTTGGAVIVSASSSPLTVAISAAGAGGKGIGLSGSFTINSIANAVDAHISDGSTITSSGDVDVEASESAAMYVASLAVGGATQGIGVGVAFAYNFIGGDSALDPNALTITSTTMPAGSNGSSGPSEPSPTVGDDGTTKTSNVTAYIDASKVTAAGSISVLSGLNNPLNQQNSGPATASTVTVDPSTAVTANAAQNELVFASPQTFVTGQEVQFTKGTSNETGLSTGTYYVIVVNATTIQLAATHADALAGAAVNILAGNTGSASVSLIDTDHAYNFDPSQASVTAAAGSSPSTITFGTAHGLTTGEEVVYDDGGQAAIGGLVEGHTYTVTVVDSNTVSLVDASNSNAQVVFTAPTAASGNQQSFSVIQPAVTVHSIVPQVVGANTIAFAKTSTSNPALPTDPGLATGTAVVYHASAGNTIGGLNDGQTYYVVKASGPNANDVYYQLATSYDAATATNPPFVAQTSAAPAGTAVTLVATTGNVVVGGLSVDLPQSIGAQVTSVTVAAGGGKTVGGPARFRSISYAWAFPPISPTPPRSRRCKPAAPSTCWPATLPRSTRAPAAWA